MLSSLKQQKSMLSQFWGQMSEIPVWQGGAPSRGPRGESFLPLPAAGGSSVPGLLAPAPVSASLRLHMPSSLGLCLSKGHLSLIWGPPG